MTVPSTAITLMVNDRLCGSMPLTVPVMRILEACRGERTEARILRPQSGKPIDGLDCYRMVIRISTVAGIPRHISPLAAARRHHHALDAGVPLREAQTLPRHADPRTTEH